MSAASRAGARANAGELVAGLAGQVLVSASLGRVWQRRSGKTGNRPRPPVPRTSVAPPVCHQCCCHDHHQDDHGCRRGVRPWSRGRADPGRAVRAGRGGAGGDRDAGKAAAQVPSRVGVYFVLAMCLFPRPGYLGVWAKLTAALGLASPSAKALRELRRRIGIAPLKALFEILAGPLGHRHTPGIMFRGYRTVSFDGCKSIKVPIRRRTGRGWASRTRPAARPATPRSR